MEIGNSWSKEYKITEDVYRSFLSLSEDNNPMHVDDSFAQQFGFREKVIHGNLLNVFLSYAIGKLIPLKNIVIIDQTIKYKKPIYLGFSIKMTITLSNIIESVGVQKFKFCFENSEDNQQLSSGSISIKIL